MSRYHLGMPPLPLRAGVLINSVGGNFFVVSVCQDSGGFGLKRLLDIRRHLANFSWRADRLARMLLEGDD